ncbi:MAG: hypothetical protein SGJ27_14075 [Candidatus Melainabacteria bacterium]|nr:hypothetical protein [Candidatus Melainabacteria bacterium]
MGLLDDREAKKQEKADKTPEKRKPKLTYVHGLDGRRYINDKILRNLEGSQGGKSFSTYSSVANYESQGYLSYDDLMEETEKLTQEASGAGNPYDNSFDQFAPPSQEDGISVTHAQAAEVANADLEAAFQAADSVGRTVHATMNDMSLGAFQAQAFNNTPPEAQMHGVSETQGAPEVHAEKVTGDINTTIYDGYHEAAQNAPFAFKPVMSDEAFNAAYQQVAGHEEFAPPPQSAGNDDFAPENQQISNSQNEQSDNPYAAPGAVGKPTHISGQQSNYGMLASPDEVADEKQQGAPHQQLPPQHQPQQQPAEQFAPQQPVEQHPQQPPQQRPPLGMSVSQSMRALPPPVKYETHEQPPAPPVQKEEYNKLLGGLFKDEDTETPTQSAPLEQPVTPPTQAPSFNQALQQAQGHAHAPAHQYEQSHQAQHQESQDVQPPQEEHYAPQAEQQSEQFHQQQQQQPQQLAQQEPQFEPPAAESVPHVESDAPPAVQQAYVEQAEDARSHTDNVESSSSSSRDSLVDFSTTEQPKPKFDRKKPPLPKQRADEVYFEDNATSGKTAIFKMPTEGVVRSSRGTVELLVHKGGRMFRPHYNPVGILLRVDVSDGFALIKGQADKAPWQMTDREGNPLDEDVINTVAFDKKGNLWYQTVTGKKTRFLVDGGVEVTSAEGEVTKM